MQSYVDTILRGCLDVGGDEFAKEFVRKTKGWNPKELIADSKGNSVELKPTGAVWVDDRVDPVYSRGDQLHSLTNANQFDSLLEAFIPDSFRGRKPLQPTPQRSLPILS